MTTEKKTKLETDLDELDLKTSPSSSNEVKAEIDLNSQDKLGSPPPKPSKLPTHEDEASIHLLEQSQTEMDEPWMEETLAQLKAASELTEDLSRGVPQDLPQDLSEDLSLEVENESASSSEEEGMLEMTIQGKITLKLKRNSDGQDVLLRFGNGHLQILLSDGMEFKIPMQRKGLKRVA